MAKTNTTKKTASRTDILIVGGGYNGLTLACLLKEKTAIPLTITILDPKLTKTGKITDPRHTALTPIAVSLLSDIQIWEALKPQTHPITHMHLTDTDADEPLKPESLSLNAAKAAPLAVMVPNAILLTKLRQKALEHNVTLITGSYKTHNINKETITITTEKGESLTTTLLIGADGKHSRVRKTAGIKTISWDYDQAALTGTLFLTKSLATTAIQHFLPTGPLALLPLKPDRNGTPRASLIWSDTRKNHEKRQPDLTKNTDQLIKELNTLIDPNLTATISFENTPHVYPLSFLRARKRAIGNIALIGDAAQAIHPIAGQGLNTGLQDVAALAKAILQPQKLGLPLGYNGECQAYQSARTFDSFTRGVSNDVITKLFTIKNPFFRLTRSTGMNIINTSPPLKEMMIKIARNEDALKS